MPETETPESARSIYDSQPRVANATFIADQADVANTPIGELVERYPGIKAVLEPLGMGHGERVGSVRSLEAAEHRSAKASVQAAHGGHHDSHTP